MRYRVFRPWLCVSFAIAVLATASSPAGASGVTRIQQIDGSIQIYNDVRMRLDGKNLWITSADGRGTLEIRNAACSYTNEIERCLPYAIMLRQHGLTHPIAIHHGAVYLNLTNDMQHMAHSSRQLAPHGLLVVLRTQRGTFVSVNGTLDEVKQ